ncbi:hypothetical protein KJA13_01230 [Patescibacteria group bacterium]|nr:hypothetical protein [Patescibacteria group bacterium]
MKVKDIIAEIAQCSEYRQLVELVEFCELVRDDPDLRMADIWEDIYELLYVLEETIYTRRKAFLEKLTRSYRSKNAAENKIYFGGMQNVQAARDAFVRQVKEQMPVYIQLMDLIEAQTRAEKQKETAIAAG